MGYVGRRLGVPIQYRTSETQTTETSVPRGFNCSIIISGYIGEKYHILKALGPPGRFGLCTGAPTRSVRRRVNTPPYSPSPSPSPRGSYCDEMPVRMLSVLKSSTGADPVPAMVYVDM